MGIDGKYGRVTTEHGNIGHDEPVIVYRAQDELLPEILMHYRLLCKKAGSPERHIDAIMDTLLNVVRWQTKHHTKTPTSDGYQTNQGWTGK